TSALGQPSDTMPTLGAAFITVAMMMGRIAGFGALVTASEQAHDEGAK
ncbi:MAG: hypothetical protein JHC92_04405, partial [Sphingomonadaceae bacterium]|nr:hypothetical protein [Sphingomonadaceae bacterium]